MNKKTPFYFMAAVLFFSGKAVADPLSATLTINPDATLSSDRLVVTISGTYSCSPLPQAESAFATITVNVSQASGRQVAASGFFGVQPICDGQLHPFKAGAHASNIPWHGGKGRVMANLFIQSCESSPCETVTSSVDKPVSIRGGGQ